MSNVPSLVDMLASGIHLGHKKSKRHPKMAEYIFTTKGEISIIDLSKTQEMLATALNYVENLAANGKNILFVGTKKQGQEIIKKHALACGMPYVHTRWVGGTLTNFAIISKLIKKYKTLQQKQESGELGKYTKKEQLEFSREIDELRDLIGGIDQLTKLPDAVFILDIKKDNTALRESLKKHLPIVALCDSNTNPDDIDYPIPSNDDAIKSIEMMVGLIAKAYSEGKTKQAAKMVAKAEDKDAVAEAPAAQKAE